jgi:thiol-disulfide isomerase/thioredoxin
MKLTVPLTALTLLLSVLTAFMAVPGAQAAVTVTAVHSPDPVLEGDGVTVDATVGNGGAVTEVLIQICVGIICDMPQSMTDKGGGLWSYDFPETLELNADDEVHADVWVYEGIDKVAETNVTFTVYPQPTALDLSAVVTPGTVYPDESVTINGTLLYDNTLPAGGAQISAKITGVGITEKVTADDTGYFSLPYTAPSDEGSYDITLSASIDTFQTSSDLPLKVVLEPKPDLEVTGVELSQTEAFTGDLITINATVANTGNANATATTLGVYAGAVQVAEPDVGALTFGTGETLYIEWDTTGTKEGVITLSFSADFGALVAESDEEDNTFTADVTLTEWVEPDPVGEGTHVVFVEMFSTTWCGPCVKAEAAMEKLWYETEEHYFHFVTLVTDVNEEADERMDPFGFTSVPDAVFDGGVEIETGAGDDVVDIYRGILGDVGAREVPDAVVDVTIDDVTATSVDITVKGKSGSNLDAFLRVYVYEPLSRHNDVDDEPIPNGFLGFAAREDVTLGSNVREFSYSFEGTGMASDNIAVAAVLFDSEDEAFQSDAEVFDGDYKPSEAVGKVLGVNHSFDGGEMTVTAEVEGDGDPVVRYWVDGGEAKELEMVVDANGTYVVKLPPMWEDQAVEYQVVMEFLGEETGSSTKESTVVPKEGGTDGEDGEDGNATDGGEDGDNTLIIAAAVVGIIAVVVIIALMMVMKGKAAAAAAAKAGEAGAARPAPGTSQPSPGSPQPVPGAPQPAPGTPQPAPAGPQPAPGVPGPAPGTPQPAHAPAAPAPQPQAPPQQ